MFWIFIRQLFQRYRLWRLELTLLDTQLTDPWLVTRISLLTDEVLLQHYRSEVGKTVDIVTGLNNAEEALEWLTKLTTLIETQDFFSDSLTYILGRRTTVILDDWLVTKVGGSVQPLLLHTRMQQQLLLLERAYNAVSDVQLKKYYQPKLPILLQDVYAIQEGLLTSAINL